MSDFLFYYNVTLQRLSKLHIFHIPACIKPYLETESVGCVESIPTLWLF